MHSGHWRRTQAAGTVPWSLFVREHASPVTVLVRTSTVRIYVKFLRRVLQALLDRSCRRDSSMWFILTGRNQKRRLVCHASCYTLPTALLIVSMRSKLLCADMHDACLNPMHAKSHCWCSDCHYMQRQARIMPERTALAMHSARAALFQSSVPNAVANEIANHVT